MNKSKIAAITVAVLAVGVAVSFLFANIRKIPGLAHMDPTLLQGIVLVIGTISAAIVASMVNAKFSVGSKPSGGSGGAAHVGGLRRGGLLAGSLVLCWVWRDGQHVARVDGQAAK